MLRLLFYVPFAIALASAIVVAVIGIRWQALVSEVLRRTPKRMTLAGRLFARLNISMFDTIGLAEQVDKALAKRMRVLVNTLCIAGLICFVFGLLALLIGGVVFGG